MTYEYRIVAFIDILGFRSLISKTILGGKDNEPEIDNLYNALLVARNVFDKDISSKDFASNKKITQFSDSFVISFPVTDKEEVFFTLLEIQWLLMNYISFGIICRGGIAFGKLIHTDKVIFGPGLVNAYDAETKAAIYPRVILHESIINFGSSFKIAPEMIDYERESILNIVSKDSDGMYYIDYFTKCKSEFDNQELDFPDHILKLQKIINSGLQTGKYDLLVKYGWIVNKYNEMVKQHTTNEALSFYKNNLPELSNFYRDLKEINFNE